MKKHNILWEFGNLGYIVMNYYKPYGNTGSMVGGIIQLIWNLELGAKGITLM
jgi:hypothetical protein